MDTVAILKCVAQDHKSAFIWFIAHWDWWVFLLLSPQAFSATPISIVFLSHEDTNQTMRTDYAEELSSSWVKSTIQQPENLKGKSTVHKRESTFVSLTMTSGQVCECWHTPEQSIKACCCLLFSKQQRGPFPCPPGVCFVLLAFLWG